MVNNSVLMDNIWSQLTFQIIQQVYKIKPNFWIFMMRSKSNGLLIFNFENEHPCFSIQNKIDSPLLKFFSESGLTDKLKGSLIHGIKISEDHAIIMSLKNEHQSFVLKFQLAPSAPRFQLLQSDVILYDSILGWHPKENIKSKASKLVIDHSLDVDLIIRYSYSLDYLQIIKKTLARKNKRQLALIEDLHTHTQALGYQAIAEAIQSQPNRDWQHYPNPNQLPAPDVNFKANYAGINQLFQLYKKAKKGVSLSQIQLNLNAAFLERLYPFSIMNPPLSNKDLSSLKAFLEKEHLLSALEPKPTEVFHQSPYYVEFQGVRFSYGKNAKQNHQLTFSIAKKNDIFMHIEGKPGSHVVIHHSQFDHDLMIRGAQIVLALAKQMAGTITYAKVGSLKQTKTLGQVLIKDSKTIKANADLEFSSKILENSKRY